LWVERWRVAYLTSSLRKQESISAFGAVTTGAMEAVRGDEKWGKNKR